MLPAVAALITFTLHPNSSVLLDDATGWTALHLVLVAIYPLLALSVGCLGRSLDVAVRLPAYVALFVFGAASIAFDSGIGVASGVLSLAGDEIGVQILFRDTVFAVIWRIAGSAWLMAILLIALGFRDRGASWLNVGLLAFSAIPLTIDHAPPFGPVAIVAYMLAAARLELGSPRSFAELTSEN